jgi:hypothetical protein
LRLNGNDAAAEREEAADVIAGVGADVEHEIAAADEGAVQRAEPALPEWNRVVDRDRSCETEGAVEGHLWVRDML